MRTERPIPEQVLRPAAWEALGTDEEVAPDYRTVGLSLRGHPVTFVRPIPERRG